MALSIHTVREKNYKLMTLEKEYDLEDNRKVPRWDDEAQNKKTATLKKKATEIKLASAGVEKQVHYLDKILVSMARGLLKAEGFPAPEGGIKGLEGEELKAKQKAISEYLVMVDKKIDEYGADVYVSLSDEMKPYGLVALADGSQQRTIDGAITEGVAEKNKEAKGKKNGKVTTKKIKDDGSEAEAASECVTSKDESVISGGGSKEASESSLESTNENADCAEASPQAGNTRTAKNASPGQTGSTEPAENKQMTLMDKINGAKESHAGKHAKPKPTKPSSSKPTSSKSKSAAKPTKLKKKS